jgi:hypothetical protein
MLLTPRVDAHMIASTHKIVAVTIRPLETYSDLVSQGFSAGHVIECSQCDCPYRVFYRPEASILEQSLLHQPVQDAIERSHVTGHQEDRFAFSEPSSSHS